MYASRNGHAAAVQALLSSDYAGIDKVNKVRAPIGLVLCTC